MQIRRNHEILRLLKVRVSTNPISKKFNISYSKAKIFCIKLNWSGDCSRVPDSGRNLLIDLTVLLLKVTNLAFQPNKT